MFGKKKAVEDEKKPATEAAEEKRPGAEEAPAAETAKDAGTEPAAEAAEEARPASEFAEERAAEAGAEMPAAEKPAAEEKQPEAAAKPAEPDWKDRYARLMADFDNFKKRTARDREDTYRFAESDIIGDILPTVDNLSLALANAKNAEDDFVKGVRLVYDTLLKALKDHGAEPFDSVGLELDTSKMEAIATLPSPDFDEGKVSFESKKGWMLKDKVLRAAQVVVSSGKPDAAK